MKLFTKTQFKLGMDCPTKLYYSEKDEYVDISSTDPFLEAFEVLFKTMLHLFT